MAGAGKARPRISAHDFAAYILWKRGEITAMKLQKLLYYAQAWNLVRNGAPMFLERIEAWVDGPVVVDVFRFHAGKLNLSHWPQGDATRVAAEQEARRIEAWTWSIYGSRTGDQLRVLSHRDLPWIECRRGLKPREAGNREIPVDLIKHSFDSTQYAFAGDAYMEGRLSIVEAAELLRMSVEDAIFLFEDMGFSRPLEVILLDDATLEQKLRRIRRDRMELDGIVPSSEEEARKTVVASQRIEGIDARPWTSR